MFGRCSVCSKNPNGCGPRMCGTKQSPSMLTVTISQLTGPPWWGKVSQHAMLRSLNGGVTVSPATRLHGRKLRKTQVIQQYNHRDTSELCAKRPNDRSTLLLVFVVVQLIRYLVYLFTYFFMLCNWKSAKKTANIHFLLFCPGLLLHTYCVTLL